MSEYNKQKNLLYRTSGNQIGGINAEYGQLIDEQKQYNKSFEAGTGVEGIVSGRERYAPVIQIGIMSDVVNTGLQKVADLVSKKKRAVQEAIDARDTKNFELLDTAMKNKAAAEKAVRDAAQKELENSIKISSEERASKKFAREEGEANAENLAPSILSILGDDNDENLATIQEIAAERGIEPNLLLKAIQDHQATVADRQSKNLPTLAREYEYARKNGFFNGGFLEYQKLRSSLGKSAPKSKVLSLKEANKLGLLGLEGVSEDELIYDLVDPTPPMWFIEREFPFFSPTPTTAQKAWDKFRLRSDLVNFTKGINPNSSTNWMSALQSLPTADGQLPDDTLDEE